MYFVRTFTYSSVNKSKFFSDQLELFTRECRVKLCFKHTKINSYDDFFSVGGQFYLIKLLFKLSYSYEPNCDLLCLWWWGCAGYVVEVAQDMWWKLRRICGV